MEQNYNIYQSQHFDNKCAMQIGTSSINIQSPLNYENKDVKHNFGIDADKQSNIKNGLNLAAKDIGSCRILIWKAYLSRLNGSDVQFLVSFTDSQHKRMCSWVCANELQKYDNFIHQVNFVNQQNAQNDFLNLISRKIELSPLEEIEIITKNKNEYLFKLNYNGFGLFFWDIPKNDNIIELTQKFEKRENNLLNRRNNLNNCQDKVLNEGQQFLRNLKQEDSCIFVEQKSEVVSFLSVFNGSAIILAEDDQFENWCKLLEMNYIYFVGYYGDKFTRAMKRQFQIKSNMIILSNYKSMFKDIMYFDDKIDLLIIDNAQKIKNQSGRRFNLISSIKYKSSIFIVSYLTIKFHDIWKGISKNTGKIFYGKTSTTKHIFLYPTDYQLDLYRKNVNERLKISNHCLLIDNIETFFPKLNRYQLLLNLSSKFIFMIKLVKNTKDDIFIHSKSKRLLTLFEELCKYENIKTIYYDDDEIVNKNNHVVLCNCFPKTGIIYSFDTELPNSYRIVTYGTIEHRLLSEASILRNVENEVIFSVPKPKRIDEIFEYNVIENKFFDFKPIIQEKENIFETTEQTIHKLCKFGYLGKNQYETFIVLALLRAIIPPKISKFPLLLNKLIPNIPNCNLSLAICNNKKMWLEPLKHLFNNIDLSGIKMRREHIFHSAEKILLKIERRQIVLVFKQYYNNFKFHLLKDYDNSDVQLVSMIMNGNEPINKEKRINEIITIMKSELILIKSLNRFILPFWTKYEIKQILNTISNFGASLVSQNPILFHSKTGILSKKTIDVSDLASKVLNMISCQNNYSSISLNFNVSNEYLLNGIVNNYPIESDVIYELKHHINQNEKINYIFEHYKKQNPFNIINSELTNANFIVFLSFITKFGLLEREKYVISPLFVPSKNLKLTEISFLNGKYPIYSKEKQSLFPFYLINNFQFQLFLEKMLNLMSNELKTKNECLNKFIFRNPVDSINHTKPLPIGISANINVQENESMKLIITKNCPEQNNVLKIVSTQYPDLKNEIPKKQQLNSISSSEQKKQSQIRASQETARRMTEDFLRTLPHRARSTKEENNIDFSNGKINQVFTKPVVCNNSQKIIRNPIECSYILDNNMIPDLNYPYHQPITPLPIKKQLLQKINNNAYKGS